MEKRIGLGNNRWIVIVTGIDGIFSSDGVLCGGRGEEEN